MSKQEDRAMIVSETVDEAITKLRTIEKLLAHLRQLHHKRDEITHGYRTGRKNSSYGSRDCIGPGQLVKAGMVRIISQQCYVDAYNAYSDHWTETVYELIGE